MIFKPDYRCIYAWAKWSQLRLNFQAKYGSYFLRMSPKSRVMNSDILSIYKAE